MLMNKLIEAAGNSTSATYVEDVFSTYLYTGTGASQTITNGIDLSTKGGMVWLKNRGTASSNLLYDTTRGAGYQLGSDLTIAQGYVGNRLTAFTGSGYTIDGTGSLGVSGENYASWTFRKAPKFFDVVTFTADASGNASINHSLGCAPGMVIVKCLSSSTGWMVYHKGFPSTRGYMQLNATNAMAQLGSDWLSFDASKVNFINGMGLTASAPHVAYLFADSNSGGFGASGTDSIVACGSYSGSSSAVSVTLGWEPQWLLIKKVTSNNAVLRDWLIVDNMRGLPVLPSYANGLFPNTSGAETANNEGVHPSSTGFTLDGSFDRVCSSGETYIYLAIRRGPMKTPTDATKVFATTTGISSATTPTYVTNFPVDLAWQTRPSNADGMRWYQRLSSGYYMSSSNTAAEAADSWALFDSNNGWYTNTGSNYRSWNFRRAPGFFDVVCYTGTGSATTVAHGLTVAPELMIVKSRTDENSWVVYSSAVGNGYWLGLNLTNASISASDVWNTTSPTSSVVTIGTNARVNTSSFKYIACLFATCPGVSKCGSYTGNGGSQTINCGFTAGARFVLIKRTDASGDWMIWDVARGLVAANDPHLSLNTTAAEVTTDDSIDPDPSGFIVNQVAATNINATGASYIFLAIA